MLVWLLGLLLFYAAGSSNLEEAWYIPGSFLILLGYFTKYVGIIIYYDRGAHAA
jgi:hypothetical protein